MIETRLGRATGFAWACLQVAVLLGVLGAAPHAWGSTQSGLVHFEHGEFAEALADWQTAASAGDAAAALLLGVSYDVGEGVAVDQAQAVAWYRQAAAGGSAAAMFNLGVLYDSGLGVAQDRMAAAGWYRQAAAAGFARADYNLGLLHEDGTLTPRSGALPWFRRALRHGIAAAAPHLAAFGEPPRTPGPRQAEDQGLRAFQAAQTALLNRKPNELSRAVALFQQAAEHNNPLAAYDLGYCYENAIGVTGDVMQGYRWYRRAALTANDEALRTLAGSSADRLARRLTSSSLRQAQALP